MSVPDIVVAVIAFLRADEAVAELAAEFIYYEELAKQRIEAWGAGMPKEEVVVVRRSGGPSDRARIRYQRQRIDVFCYGRTPRKAADLEIAVYDALKQMVPHNEGPCRIWDAEVSSGAIALREQDTKWPLVFRSYVVSAAEVAVA